jgi:hypothetical protein
MGLRKVGYGELIILNFLSVGFYVSGFAIVGWLIGHTAITASTLELCLRFLFYEVACYYPLDKCYYIFIK